MYTTPDYDGLQAVVYYEDRSSEDERYYYTKWMQDHGWHKNIEGGWTGGAYSAIRRNLGSLYLNPKMKVAIYFDVENESYYIFSVRFQEYEE